MSFIDLPENISDIQLLSMIANELDTKGVIFERSTPRHQKIISTTINEMRLRISRLQMIEELYARNTGIKVNITCDACDARTTCRSAYDPYNTDGDCLEDK